MLKNYNNLSKNNMRNIKKIMELIIDQYELK